MPSLKKRNQTGNGTPPPGPPPSPPTAPAPGGGAPLPLPAELEASAREFKKLFDDHGAKYHRVTGQFALLDVMKSELRAKISGVSGGALKSELSDLIEGRGWQNLKSGLFHSEVRLSEAARKSLPPSDPDSSKLAGVLKTKSIVNTARIYRETTTYALRLVNESRVSGDRALAKEILDDRSGDGQWSWTTVSNWISAPSLGPVTFDRVSLPRLAALYLNCTVQCGLVASFTAKKLLQARGVAASTIPAFPAISLTSLTAKDSRSTPGNLMLNYNPTQLDGAVQAARTVLATGYLVAGCLSGKDYEKADHPFPEHYILLFAANGDEMLFWDPDAGVTNIAELGDRLGPAIGVIFHDHMDPAKPKLSTGRDFTDLSSLSGSSGDHAFHQLRHRYQIVTLAKP